MPLRKTYTEMLDRPRTPEVCVTEKAMMGIPAGVKMLISSPHEIRAFLATIPTGQHVPISQLRDELAKQHDADVTCPLTTGIFLRIVAEAAWEDHEKGTAIGKITPFWRVIDPKDKVAKKLRCGVEWLEMQREAEGIVLSSR